MRTANDRVKRRVEDVGRRGGRCSAGNGGAMTIHATLKHGFDERGCLFERFIADVHESIVCVWHMDTAVIVSVCGAVAGLGLS